MIFKVKSFQVILCLSILFSCKNQIGTASVEHGDKIDSLDNVIVFYNDGISNVSSGRNTTKRGYNLGLKYQCVEFVKRYYYERYQHEMPNSYGNAKDFFNSHLKDGELNVDRGLVQFKNPSRSVPKKGDLVVFDGSIFNEFGHVAIVSKVTDSEIEVIQQNCGTSTRETFTLLKQSGKYVVQNDRMLGWLRYD